MTASPFFIETFAKAPLLEIPVTIVITLRWLKKTPFCLSAYQWIEGKQNGRYLRLKLMIPQPLWLSPRPGYTLTQLRTAWSYAEGLGLPAAVMMFHSSELMPGSSPFWPDEKAVTKLLSTLEEFFVFVQTERINSCSLTSAARMISASPGIPRRIL